MRCAEVSQLQCRVLSQHRGNIGRPQHVRRECVKARVGLVAHVGHCHQCRFLCCTLCSKFVVHFVDAAVCAETLGAESQVLETGGTELDLKEGPRVRHRAHVETRKGALERRARETRAQQRVQPLARRVSQHVERAQQASHERLSLCCKRLAEQSGRAVRGAERRHAPCNCTQGCL